MVGAEWQNRRHVDPNWYLGKGKAEELVSARAETGFTLLIADDELKPNQQKALETLLGVKILDRSGLILDIFAQHARTHEGRLQVELAQLEYQLPRLTRLWTHLSRTGGGIGTRGPGESQLETDRRLIRERIKKLKERVEDVRAPARDRVPGTRPAASSTTVSIVGYTNAGKSSLLNALTGTEAARAEDRLFATLDPTSRSVKLGDGQIGRSPTDTVGFIHKLPHQLVDAFRATLEEVLRADVLIEVVDASDRHAPEHRRTVQAVLDELGAGDKPRLVVWNKVDLLEPAARRRGARAGGRRARCSCPRSRATAWTRCGRRLAALLADLWEDVDVTSRTARASCWRGSGSAARSRSTTAARTSRARAAWHRRWPASCARRRSAGQRQSVAQAAEGRPHRGTARAGAPSIAGQPAGARIASPGPPSTVRAREHAGGLPMPKNPRTVAPRSRIRGACLLASLAIAFGLPQRRPARSPLAAAPGLADPTSRRPDPPLPDAPVIVTDGAALAVIDPSLQDLHPQPWDSISVSADGRTLTVYFYNGVSDCYGLGKVDVSSDSGRLTVTLFTGRVPGSQVCVELAQLYKTIITLQQPLIVDGAAVDVN